MFVRLVGLSVVEEVACVFYSEPFLSHICYLRTALDVLEYSNNRVKLLIVLLQSKNILKTDPDCSSTVHCICVILLQIRELSLLRETSCSVAFTVGTDLN